MLGLRLVTGDFSLAMFAITTRTACIPYQGRELRRAGLVPQAPGALLLTTAPVDCIIDTTAPPELMLRLRDGARAPSSYIE